MCVRQRENEKEGVFAENGKLKLKFLTVVLGNGGGCDEGEMRVKNKENSHHLSHHHTLPSSHHLTIT